MAQENEEDQPGFWEEDDRKFWSSIAWGKPHSPRRSLCASCHCLLTDDMVPLAIWSKEGYCAEFCDDCQHIVITHLCFTPPSSNGGR